MLYQKYSKKKGLKKELIRFKWLIQYKLTKFVLL
jgi:hypothetical protein